MRHKERCNLPFFNIDDIKEEGKTLYESLVDQVELDSGSAEDMVNMPDTLSREYMLFFENQFKLKYTGKHFNIPEEHLILALENVMIDNMFTLQLISKIDREQVDIRDMIFTHYGNDFQNDGPILATYDGPDEFEDKDTITHTEKRKSYSYSKLNVMLKTNDIKKKELFNSLFKEFDKIFWSVLCHRHHVYEEVEYA